AYVVAAVLFVLSLAGLARQETARRGNVLGMVGMGLALGATVILAADTSERPVLVTMLLVALVLAIGASVGTWRARTVEMTQMPEIIAIMHPVVRIAAVLVSCNACRARKPSIVHDVEVIPGVLIGAGTFTGSIVAYLKPAAKIR